MEGMFQFSIRWSLLPAFLIASITGALKTMGNLTMCEKINDADWKAPDLNRMGNGLLADSPAVTASGPIGGLAPATSASNPPLTSPSGPTTPHTGLPPGRPSRRSGP